MKRSKCFEWKIKEYKRLLKKNPFKNHHKTKINHIKSQVRFLSPDHIVKKFSLFSTVHREMRNEKFCLFAEFLFWRWILIDLEKLSFRLFKIPFSRFPSKSNSNST